MWKYSLVIILLASFKSKAQVTISGRVLDNKNKSVPATSITIKNSYDGATSDSAGNYFFSTDAKGDQILEISATGYKPFEQKINLSGTSQVINISLRELVTELNAVMITAGAFEASDQKKATVLNPIDIVTTASANGDVTGAIKTLPGTQQVGESEGLFVRGGSAAQVYFLLKRFISCC